MNELSNANHLNRERLENLPEYQSLQAISKEIEQVKEDNHAILDRNIREGYELSKRGGK